MSKAEKNSTKTTNGSWAENRILPNAKDIEKAVLGAILLERDAFDIAKELLRPESFYTEAHEIIFSIIDDMSRKGTKIDLLTVSERIVSEKATDKIGGLYYLTELTRNVVSASNLEEHCRIVYEKSLRRSLIKKGGRIADMAYNETLDVFEVLNESSKDIYDLSINHSKKSFQSIDKILVESLTETEELRHRKYDVIGVPTGYKSLDRFTAGWQPTDLIIIAARPSVGKTAFAINLARNAARNPYKPIKPAFFSLEMSSKKIVQRIQSLESKIPLEKIRRARLTDEEMKLLHAASGRIAKYPWFIDDTAALTIYEFRAKARRLVEKYGVGIIFLDYLQLMSGEGKTSSREQEISTISRNLKATAKELKVPIIALSQLSREIENRKPPMPRLSDLRESGAIEQDADIVMFLSRSSYQKEQGEIDPSLSTEAEVKFAKHRDGEILTLPFHCIGDTCTWMDKEMYERFETAKGMGSNYKPLAEFEGF